MTKNLFTLFAALALGASAAMAAPLLTLTIAGPAGTLGPVSSSTGVASIPVTAFGNFSVSATAYGVQTQGPAGLDLQTLDVTTTGLVAPETLTITVLQTGLTTPTTPSSFLNAFTALLRNNAVSATLSTYLDSTNAGIANAGNRIATTTFTASGSNSVNLGGTGNPSALFSETAIITLVFGPGNGTINAEVSLANAPEPGALALMGSGLLAIAFARLRRK